MRILISGGCGFIGSALIRMLISNTKHTIMNVDALTYASSQESTESVKSSDRYTLANTNINNFDDLESIFCTFEPDKVIHLAAESHVDNSIVSPDAFMKTNIFGTYNMLEVSRKFWESLGSKRKSAFRFHHVSTDEVYGSCVNGEYFLETTPYQPNSPYSASKASSDHLVRAWNITFGLPTLITNCSNNYGPYQNPEKLIPLVISRAISGKEIPIYGDGKQIRDWLHVDDHIQAIMTVLEKGKIGSTYNIGSSNERTNIEVVNLICEILQSKYHSYNIKPHLHFCDLITHVKDRLGHDQRYAINAAKIIDELGWKPSINFITGLEQTVDWYIENLEWLKYKSKGSI